MDPAPHDDRRLALRASDADRDHVAKLLGEALAEGRLDTEEHAERVDGVYAAKTLGELRPFVADLPVAFAPPSTGGPGAGPATAPASVHGADLGVPGAPDRVMAVFGEQKRRGRWLVRNGLDVKAVFGSVELDLTEAVLEQRELHVSVTSILGEVKLIVPEGVLVVDEGTSILGERNMALSATAPYTADTPIVHVRGYSVLGNVEARRPKRPSILKDWFRHR
jgi:hypothetical protein